MLSPELLNKARSLPQGVLRLLDYARSVEPTTMLICDCDARPIGRSLEFLAAAQEKPLPSVDKILHYRRVSRRTPPEKLMEHLAEFFEQTATLAEGDQPRILVLDDHVSSGGTIRNFKTCLKKSGLEADVRWATYTGRGVDFSCFPHIGPGALMPWRDRPEVLGISYDDAMQPIDRSSELSREFYEAIAEGAVAAVSEPAIA